MAILQEQEVRDAFRWSAPVERPTVKGQRLHSKAPVTPEAERFWRDNKAALIAWGVNLSEYPKGSGRWDFNWWREVPKAVIEERAATVVASRQTEADIDIPLRPGLELRGFQRAGVAFALKRNGTLIGDEMGLGKTVQAICLINADPKCAKVLIVCPSGLTVNWFAELSKWLTREMDIGIADGKVFPTSDVVIIGWAMLPKWQGRLDTTHFDAIVLDEAQYMKNPKAKRSQVILGYKPRRASKGNPAEPVSLARAPLTARRRIAMSGTPIENRPIEIFPVINWLDPVNWGNWFSFAKTYCGAHDNGFGFDASGASNLEELQRKLRETVMIRRKKADVLTELPPKTRMLVTLPSDGEAGAEERRALAAKGIDIEARVAEMKARIELAKAGDSAQEYAAAVDAMSKGMSVDFTEVAAVRHATALAKLPAAIEAIREDLETANKIVVWAHHVDVLKALEQAFQEYGCVAAWGEHDAADRQQKVNRFQTDPRIRVFVAGILPMGTGFTMTAANLAIFVELDWVPGKMAQAEDRLHRIGQLDNVLVKHLVLEGTIDAAVAKTLVRKMDIIDRALDRRTGEAGTDPFAVIEMAEPVVPASRQPVSATRKQIVDEAQKMTPERIAVVGRLLRALAMSCDGARAIDGAGFNKIDSALGKSLAAMLMLSPKQAALGARLVRKYKRQLPPELVAVAIGDTDETTD